ncbi:troponin I-like [Dendronephthya gigantea]|uniref:troponin I-like n=1 Tax=Dendronephthya gigantea TaxID=151771 RepID=UPI00106CC93E|nr:troponin I-like [Dendronephthya gigantea]
MDSDRDVDHIKEWSMAQKDCITQFRKERDQCKAHFEELQKHRREQQLRIELEEQKRLSIEKAKLREKYQMETEASIMKQHQAEEEWIRRKLYLQKLNENTGEGNDAFKKSTSTVKLQRYTITPFSRDYKDWLRFWNPLMS